MFIQVVRGKVKDAAALRAAEETWQKELQPGAKGFLGSTSGVADDGTAVIVARFDSEASARANSERPEQGAWYEKQVANLFDGDVTFLDCSDVETFLDGGSDKAGFVQIMFGKVDDVEADKELGRKFEARMPELRPDVLGGVNGYTADGRFANVTYFTSEADARAGEKKEMPADLQEAMSEFGSSIQEFVDLRDPWFNSA